MNHASPVPAPHPTTFAPSAVQSGRNLFLLFVFILPFQRVTFLRDNLFDIQGLKPFNLLSAAVLAYLVFQSAPLRATDKIEQTSFRVLLVYFATFTISLIRSIPNAPLFHDHFPDVFPDSYLDYILSNFVVPACYVLPFLVILTQKCSFRELERITTVICLSILLLSIALIILAAMNPSLLSSGSQDEMHDLVSGSRDGMAELCRTYFGLNRNTIGTVYICTTPLLLYRVLTRSVFWIVPLGLSLLAILLLQSRSALVTVAIASCLFLLQRRKFVILGLIAAALGIVSLLWVGSTIESLLSIGFDSGSDFSADALLTGRVDHIWAPLLDEWTSDIGLFLFGAGRYGMMTSELWYTGTLIRATHAHNAIIDFFLDCGAIFTFVLIILLFTGVTTALRVGRSLNNDLYWALLACIIGFGIGTMTDREIFPTIDNMYVFPIIAMMINLARLRYVVAYRG